MKVRFYRGPLDGKTAHIPDKENYWVVQSVADTLDPYKDAYSTLNTVQNVYRRTGHTHPDGSVYFEWDKPKGSKTGVKPKRSRSKKFQKQQAPVVLTGSIATTSWSTTPTSFYISPLP